jgi:hypothetical protein
MDTEVIGTYENRQTGRQYVVLARRSESVHAPLSEGASRLSGAEDFMTACGIDLQPLDEGRDSFELIQIDGVIHRIRT